jgi:probable lipoprotein NlpC
MPVQWAREYVGIPFKERGRDRDGVDCWGLACLVYRDRFGIRLPDYRDRYLNTEASDDISRIIDSEADGWTEIPTTSAMCGDVVLFRILGKPTHIGIEVGDGYMLHAERGVGVVIERHDKLRWFHRRVGFFRPRSLCA